MNRTFLAGATLSAASVAGYAAGVVAPYPGREASIVGVMVGVTLAAVAYGRGSGGTGA